MTKEEFEQLQQQQKESGLGLMAFLKRESIPYSNYNYWNKKYSTETKQQGPCLWKESQSCFPTENYSIYLLKLGK